LFHHARSFVSHTSLVSFLTGRPVPGLPLAHTDEKPWNDNVNPASEKWNTLQVAREYLTYETQVL
jgi:hypothetical protein